MNHRLVLLVVITTLASAAAVLTGCANESANEGSLDSLADGAQAGITAIGGAADDMNADVDFALARESGDVTSSRAVTACTDRAFEDSCSSGSKSATYSDCTVGSVGTLSGDVDLDFSDSGCALNSVGQSVDRTLDLDLEVSTGGHLFISTASHEDYEENTIGGPTRLTANSAASWALTMGGVNRKFVTPSGRTLFNFTTLTTEPIAVSGSLARGTRTVDGGKLEVRHNLAKFTSTYVPASLVWGDTDCCFPTSGSLAVTLDGSISGSGTVEFGSTCGEITVTKDDESDTYSLQNCQ